MNKRIKMNKSEAIDALLDHMEQSKPIKKIQLNRVNYEKSPWGISKIESAMVNYMDMQLKMPEYTSEEEMAYCIYNDINVLSYIFNVECITCLSHGILYGAVMRRGNIPRTRVFEIYDAAIHEYESEQYPKEKEKEDHI